METIQQVKTSIEEFDKFAYHRFSEKWKTKGLEPIQFMSNEDLLDILRTNPKSIVSNSIEKLMLHDTEFYGKAAKDMWEVKLCGVFVKCDYLPRETLEHPENWRRKRSAKLAIAYNFERAIKGDIIEIYKNEEWLTCKLENISLDYFTVIGKHFGTGGKVSDTNIILRYKYPPKLIG